MDYPPLNPGYSPELLSQADRLASSFATKPRAPAAPPPPEPLPDNGILTDIGHGLAGGVMVGAPRLVGQMLKYPGAPGDTLYDAGQSMVESADQREKGNDLYRTTGAWGAGANMLASGLPAMVAGPAVAAMGAPAAAVAGVGALAGAALFGGGMAQTRYEEERKLGATHEEASSTAAKEGMIQGVGQGVASAVGARVLTGGAGALARGVGIGGEHTAQGVLNSFLSPAFARKVALGAAENAAVQVPVQMGAAAASASLGKEPSDSWEAAKASVAPTLAMGALMTPLIGGGTLLNNHRRAHIADLAVAARPPEHSSDALTSLLYDGTRTRAISEIYKEMRRVDPAAADKWRNNAEVVVMRGEELPLDVGFDPDAPKQQAPAEVPAAAPVEPQRMLPPPVYAMGEQQDQPARAPGPENFYGFDPNAERWKARDAEEQRRAAAMRASEIPEVPSNAIDVSEIPGQEIHPPEYYQSRTINLRPAELPVGEVRELPVEERTLSGTVGVPITKQERATWLKSMLGRTDNKNTIIADLTAREPAELASALQKVWHDKGGDNGPKYLQRVEQLYQRLTDSDIRQQKAADETAGKNAAEETQRAEPKSAADETGTKNAVTTDKVAEEKGNADAGRSDGKTAESADELDLGRTMGLEQGGEKKVVSATIRVGGQEFDGPVHGAALNKAIAAGVLRKNPAGGWLVKENGAWRKFSSEKGDDYGLFKLDDGSTVSREAATNLTGEKKAENMPFGKGYKETTPVPPKEPTKKEIRDADRAAKIEQSRLAAERKAEQIQSAIQRHREETAKLQAQVRDIFANPNPSTQEQARKTVLEAEIAARNKREEQAVQMHTEAIAEAEDAAHGNPEVTREKSDWRFATHAWNSLAGIGRMEIDREGRGQAALNAFGAAQNLLNMADYVTARLLTGTATKREKSILSESNAYKGVSAENRRSAQVALDSLGKDELAKYVARAEHFSKSMELASAMSAKISELTRQEKVKAASETIIEMAHLKEGLAIVDRNVAEGKTTVEEGQELKRLIAAQVKDMIDKGVYDRGLNALSDKGMREHLAAKATAKDAMDYIVRNHSNPIVRMVAKLLGSSDHLSARVDVVENPTFDGGRYNTRTNTIEIGRGGLNAVTLMHETTHALVHRALHEAMLDQHQEGLAGQKKANVEAMHEINAVMEKFRDIADLDDPSHRLALESAHEFTAEALNNEHIQEMLGGRSGLWTRFTNALRGMVGIAPKNQTEFEQLLKASTTLFGDPRQDTMTVFNRSLTSFFKRDLDPTNPTDALEIHRRAMDGASAVSAKLMKQLGEKDIGARVKQEALKFLTLNHQMWLADRIGSKLIAQFPENTAVHEAVRSTVDSIRSWRRAVTDRSGLSGHLVNGKDESQDMMRSLLRQADTTPQQFLEMTKMARNAKYVGVHPSIKTFAEAKKNMPKLTEEQFNHQSAREARDTYQKLSRSHPEVIKLYDAILQKHRMDFARYYATALENTLRQAGLRKTAGFAERMNELDPMAHRDNTQAMQESKLNGVMRYMQGKLDDLHTSAKLEELKQFNSKLKAGETPLTELPQRHTPETQALRDSTLTKSAVDDLLATYDKQRATPYVHIGRSGGYHIGFEVANTPGAWEKVGKVVSGKQAEGGLERDWHAGFDGKRKVYMRFGSAAEMNEAKNRLQALKDEGLFKVEDTKNGTTKESYYDGMAIDHARGLDSATPEFIRVLSERYNNDPNLDADERAMVINTLVDTYRQQLPETSPLKASMFAENTPGASQDMLRTFGDRMTMSNQALVNARSAPRMAQAISELRQSVSKLNATEVGDAKLQLAQYAKEWMGRAQDLQVPINSPIVDTLKGTTAAWMLAMSPAYTMMTSYQPWQMTLPAIGSKYGMVRSAMTMASKTGEAIGVLKSMLDVGWGQEKGNSWFDRASSLSDIQMRFKELKNPNGSPLLSGETLGMLNALQWSGMMNFGQTQQIFRMDPTNKGVTAKTIRIATIMPHYAEMLNRIVTATTAYEMARKVGKMGIEEAQQYALQTVTNTDGNHSQANVARALGRRGIAGRVTPLFVGFGQYDIQMTEQLARVAMDAWGNTFTNKEARQAQKQLMGIATMTSLIAGTLGLPLVGLLTAAANAIGSLTSDGNDSPPDFQRAWRQHMDGIFGEKGGEIVSKGLPRAFDFDMSSRSGYQDLVPFTTFLTDRRKMDDRLKDGATTLLGPTAGIGMGVLRGAEAYSRGDYVSAINDALPAGIRNLAKAYRLSQYGYETQGGNNAIPITPSSWNVFMQAGGFVGGARAEESERTFQFNTNNDLLQRRQQELRNRFYRAVEHGDFQEVGKIMQDNVNFAVQHPQFHADVAAGLVERAKQRAVGGMAGGMLLNPRQLPYAQQMFPDLRPYTQRQP